MMETKVDDKRFLNFAHTSEQSGRNTNFGVIYTRVSSLEQLQTNDSISTQKKHCHAFAERKGITVLEEFGGTHESAKSDKDRKEFNRMLTFVKKNKKVSFVICFSFDRFSRTGAGASTITKELENIGVTVLSVTQEIDASNPAGEFNRNILYMFSHFDNMLRKEKSVTGMKEKLRNGWYVWNMPIGWDKKSINGKKKVKADEVVYTINKEGKLLGKAFHWKLEQRLTTREIVEKLKKHGMEITDKHLGRIFKNPLYCGLITSSLLPGEVIQGKHPAIVSKEVFLKVNDLFLLSQAKDRRKHHDSLWLMNFMLCDCCGKPYTGYKRVKPSGKTYYYYKCLTLHCKKNRRDKTVNEQFLKFLEGFSISPKFEKPILAAMETHFLSLNKDYFTEKKSLESSLEALEKKIEATEEKWVTGLIEEAIFLKYNTKFELEKKALLEELEKFSVDISNLGGCLEFTAKISTNLLETWKLLDIRNKKRLLEVMFPERIVYDFEKGQYRTPLVNPFFALTHWFSSDSEGNKKGEIVKFDDLPRWVQLLSTISNLTP